MVGHKVNVSPGGKGEGVEEEEAEDNHDAAKDAPPELLVHEGFDVLFPVQEIFHC